MAWHVSLGKPPETGTELTRSLPTKKAFPLTVTGVSAAEAVPARATAAAAAKRMNFAYMSPNERLGDWSRLRFSFFLFLFFFLLPLFPFPSSVAENYDGRETKAQKTREWPVGGGWVGGGGRMSGAGDERKEGGGTEGQERRKKEK